MWLAPLAADTYQEMPLKVCPTCDRLILDPEMGCLECRETLKTPTVAAPDVPEVPKARGIGPKEVLMIVAALIAGGALTLMLLGPRSKVTAGVAVPQAVTASGFAGSTREAAPATSTATWIDNRDGWVAGDRKGVAFELPARNETQVWMRKVRPLLVVRCANRTTDVFVFTDSAAAMEAQDEDHSVTFALDDQAERSERWPDSGSHDALFARNGVAFAQELGRATTLRFSYTPHNAAPVVARFDVAGLSAKLAPFAARCGGGK
jgi:hypothetical protein